MKRIPFTFAFAALTTMVVAAIVQGREPSTLAMGVSLPEFTQTGTDQWLKSAPLSVAQLTGRVVLIGFWAFEWWNCYRSFPWMPELEAQFADRPFQVVSVHSPEFEREKNIDSVRAKAKEFRLNHPIMVDSDLAFWRAMGNRFWPAYYLVDKRGRVRNVYVGETRSGDLQARRIQFAISALLAE